MSSESIKDGQHKSILNLSENYSKYNQTQFYLSTEKSSDELILLKSNEGKIIFDSAEKMYEANKDPIK